MIVNVDTNNLKPFVKPTSIYDLHELNGKSYGVICGIVKRLHDYGFITPTSKVKTEIQLKKKYLITQKGSDFLKVFGIE